MEQQVKCPKCGCMVNADVALVLNEGDTQSLKKLVSGKLNKVQCPRCKAEFVATANLVYRDVDSAFIMYLMPEPEDGDSFDQLESEVDATATDVFSQENMRRPTVRLVFSQADFIEKIFIHKMGFDDRIIEFAKLQLFRTLEEPQLSRSQHKLHLDYTKCDDDNLFFLVFDKESLKPINMIQVPMDEYRQLEQQVGETESLQMELDTAFPTCYVSAERLL